jgi:transcriptional regulator with XRE-family HTH domain
MEIFQKRLFEERQSAGLTQRQLAAMLGISQPSYIRYENGGSEPTQACLVRIADLFDVTVDYLLGRKGF